MDTLVAVIDLLSIVLLFFSCWRVLLFIPVWLIMLLLLSLFLCGNCVLFTKFNVVVVVAVVVEFLLIDLVDPLRVSNMCSSSLSDGT